MVNAAPTTQAPSKSRSLKKGEALFNEGDTSRAMYLLRIGMIRVFKRKGDGDIELSTVHAGEIIGELAFLDGNPRSASAEALTDCEVIEISGPMFVSVLAKLPDWVKVLLKTIVGRLRTSSTRLRQLETASTQYEAPDKDGKRGVARVFISGADALRVCAGLLLAAHRRSGTIEVPLLELQREVQQIQGIPSAKVFSVIDLLSRSPVLMLMKADSGDSVRFFDLDMLDRVVSFLNAENVAEPGKSRQLSARGCRVMEVISRNLDPYPADPKSNLSKVNLAAIQRAEKGPDGRLPFTIEDFAELVKLGYASAPIVQSTDNIFTELRGPSFEESCKVQMILTSIQSLNDGGRKSPA